MFKKMRNRFYLFLILFSCLNFFPFSSFLDADVGADKINNHSHPTVIAIVDITGTDGKLSNAISLMTAKLSQKSDIHLVEREELNTVLKELELSASQLVNRENALKLGKFLKADGLVFLSLSNDGKILRIRLVDTRYGLRLLDTLVEWKEGEISRIAEEIIPRITSVIPKLLIPPEKEILIGILGMRNVEPNSYLNWLELSLPRLISSRLSQEPRIIVLEREDLNLVMEENLLTQVEGGKFLGSMALLEGEIEQISTEDKKNRFALTLRIKQSDGKSIGDFKTEGKIEKLTLLTEKLASWVTKTITDSPPQGSWDIKNEAARFLREGKLLMDHVGHEDARPLIETAYALDPENEDMVVPLLYVWRYGGKPSSLERAQFAYRTIDLLATQFQRQIIDGSTVLSWLMFPWEYLNSEYSVATEEIRAFNRRSRRYCEDLSERAFLSSSVKIEKFNLSLNWWPGPTTPLYWASAVSETPGEAIQRVRKVVSKFLLRPEKGGYPIPDHSRLYFLYHSLKDSHQYYILRAGHLDRKEALNLWLGFLGELSRAEDPVVKIMAELGFSSVFSDLSLSRTDNYSQFYDHSEKVMKILIEELNYPDEPLTLDGRLMMRWALCSEAMQIKPYLSSPEIWVQKVEKLLKPLMDKGDVENLLLWTPSFVFSGVENLKTDSTVANRILNLLDSVINALENTDKRLDDHLIITASNIVIGGTVGGYEQLSSLMATRKRFLESHPDVKPENIPPPGLKVSILFDINNYLPEIKSDNKWWSVVMSEATREGKILWVSFTGQKNVGTIEGGLIGIIGINLEDKSLYALWYSSFPSVNTSQLRIKGMGVSTDATYLGVWGLGIVKFPGSTQNGIKYIENPEVITEKDGLPSNEIASIARVDNRLYISLGGIEWFGDASSGGFESGLGVYDLEKKEWKSISSSRSKDKSCPLNIERPYIITYLTPTSDGKKLFFICNQRGLPRTLDGFWKIDIESGRIEQIWKGLYNWSPSCNIVSGERNWWIRTQEMLISFDPDSETGEVVVCKTYLPGEEPYIVTRIKSSAGSREAPSMKKVSYVPRQWVEFRGENSALYKNVLWAFTGDYLVNIPSCIFINQPVPKVKRFGVDILGEDRITGLYPTPYGVVVIGKNKIGLIEENPEP